MEQQGLLVPAGQQTLISVKPVLTVTTDVAISSMKPTRRDCYVDGEAQLRYFEWEMGYFYNLNNCLFNYALHRVIRECGCRPYFMPSTKENTQRVRATCVYKSFPLLTQPSTVLDSTQESRCCHRRQPPLLHG